MSKPVCLACGNSELELCEFVDVAEQHRLYAPEDQEIQRALNAASSETALRYQMLRCRRCGLEFCEPPRAPSAAWYQLVYRALNLFSLDRWEFDEVLRRIPLGAHIFEFGCGSGNFLIRCLQRGVPASGMDFSADGVASCVAKGLAVRQVNFYSVAAPDSDPVPEMAAFHFLEHVERPAALFEHAAAKAAPSAHLWVSVPSNRRPTRRFGVRDFLDQPPHHMTRWTPEALREIGKSHGWRCVETIYEPISLRAALWSITAYTPTYQKWNAAGRFKSPIVERAYRALALPVALIQRLSKERSMSGFSMLAHFVFEGR